MSDETQTVEEPMDAPVKARARGTSPSVEAVAR